jgi:predicted DNA-binding transcriptional regulator AlpA
MEKRYLSTKEAEEYTGLCYKTLHKLPIKKVKIGNRWKWDKKSIDEYFGFSEEDAKDTTAGHSARRGRRRLPSNRGARQWPGRWLWETRPVWLIHSVEKVSVTLCCLPR